MGHYETNVTNLTNKDAYNTEMAKSAYDKLGFVDKIFEPISAIIDFGCADGSVTYLMRNFYDKDKTIIIGYDLEEIIDNGKHQNDFDNNIGFTDSLKEVEFVIKNWTDEHSGKVLLVMNSVVHEIYNYMTSEQRHELFEQLFTSIPVDYIWFRDMYVNYKSAFNSGIVNRLYKDRFKDFMDYNYIKSLNPEDFIHFLMKCRYKNWDKELKEDYLILSRNKGANFTDFVSILKYYGFNATWIENYALNYIKYINEKEFSLTLGNDLQTHKKILFRKE